MYRYVRLDLRVELDGNLDETDVENIYDVRPKVLMSSSDDVKLDGRQVVIDWDSLDSDKPFSWVELLGWDVVEYEE